MDKIFVSGEELPGRVVERVIDFVDDDGTTYLIALEAVLKNGWPDIAFYHFSRLVSIAVEQRIPVCVITDHADEYRRTKLAVCLGRK